MVSVWERRDFTFNLDAQEQKWTHQGIKKFPRWNIWTTEKLHCIWGICFEIGKVPPLQNNLGLEEWVMVVFHVIIFIHFTSSWDCECFYFSLYFPNTFCSLFDFVVFHLPSNLKGRELKEWWYATKNYQCPKTQSKA